MWTPTKTEKYGVGKYCFLIVIYLFMNLSLLNIFNILQLYTTGMDIIRMDYILKSETLFKFWNNVAVSKFNFY